MHPSHLFLKSYANGRGANSPYPLLGKPLVSSSSSSRPPIASLLVLHKHKQELFKLTV